jgi:hypothetical protein
MQTVIIPRGTNAATCRSCPATIYFVENPATGKKNPIAVDKRTLHDAQAPTATVEGKGYSHFIDCPGRDAHRRRK